VLENTSTENLSINQDILQVWKTQVRVYADGIRKLADTCLLFADDVKVYLVARSDADKVNLQSALDRISDWSVKWQMRDANFC